MPEHLTFFGSLDEKSKALNEKLRLLYSLEMQEDLTANQEARLIEYRVEARRKLQALRDLLDWIEHEHGLEEGIC